MIINDHIYKGNWFRIKDILPDITEIKSLDLSDMKLTKFPKMSHITIKCDFKCTDNKIVSFKDCPIVNGNFNCYNNKITSFKDCPYIGGNFDCAYNQITSFKDCPVIGGNMKCYNNQITSFKYCPNINGNFVCCNNKINSFKDCPEIGGYLYSDFDVFDNVQKYSNEKKISLLEAQVKLYNKQDTELLKHIDKFPDLVAYIRLKELSKLLCA